MQNREARSRRSAASTNSRRAAASKVWLKRSIVSPKKASCAASEAADEAEGQRMPSCIPVAACSKMSATAAIPARMRRALLPDIFSPDQNARNMETAVIQVLAALRQTTAVCAAAGLRPQAQARGRLAVQIPYRKGFREQKTLPLPVLSACRFAAAEAMRAAVQA